MSIEQHYTTSVSGQRQVWSANKSTLTPTATFDAHVQQSQPDFAQQLGENWGQVFKMWCALGTDVKSGDTVTVATGEYAGTYNVRNVQTFAFGDGDDHLELICIKDTP